MIDVSLGLFVSSLPWWIAAPLIQLAVLVVGMALDETYVNRTTILTGSIAAQIHIFVAGDVGLLVASYADVGLVLGAYGLYAYVIDGYVANWFRLVAYFVYSPLSVFLVILTAGPTLFGIEPLVIPALAAAGYANYQFREYLKPREPYYFGPESQLEFESILETKAAAGEPAETAPTDAETAATGENGVAAGTDTTSAATDSSTGTTTAARAGGTAPTATADGGVTTAETEAAATTSTDAGATSVDAGESPAAGKTAEFERPAPESAAADSSERGILPNFMRRL